ncbi:MAG TPA: PaaI family thioesterase [Anaerolineales bacterium]|nr:PaaI family thioesterase [Anaerolineales bacterium]
MKTKQPSTKNCFICGMENPIGLHLHIYRTAPGEVESSYVAPGHFEGYPGILHGGIVAAIIDDICCHTQIGSDPQNPRFMFSAKIEVKYRRNVPTGKMLKITAKSIKSSGRTAEAWAGIFDAESNELLAEGKTILVDVPEGTVDNKKLDELGWKVYPE